MISLAGEPPQAFVERIVKSWECGPGFQARVMLAAGQFNYGRSGIRVKAICPGFIDTPMLRGVFDAEGMTPILDDIVGAHQLGRLGRADEIAAAALFLCSADASFVTGVALPVDGGYTAGHRHGVSEMIGLG